MSVACFTSFTFSYLAKARVLAHSVKRHHPDWQFIAVITDRVPPGFAFDPSAEPFDDLIWSDEFLSKNWEGWIFRHDVVEACTAVKGPVLDYLVNGQAEKVLYLDPDTVIFSPLNDILADLDDKSILLTPHQLEPDDRQSAIMDNEMGSLQHGVYNLGFVAVRADEEGRRFARWWKERLLRFCYDDVARGVFVDQKWCDLAPAFFANLGIVRDPGCNVASWNLNRRTISIRRGDGAILCNDQPLKFFHFTKLGPIGDAMTERYAQDNFEVYELWAWYRREVEKYSEADIPARYWAYGAFDDGTLIPKEARVLYRRRSDLQAAFPHPFRTGEASLHQWLKREGVFQTEAAL